MLTLSNDGYIRLLFRDLQDIRLKHLISGLDDDSPSEIPSAASMATITGYTEWVSNSIPTITIGWDWKIDTTHNQILLLRVSELRSNIMLLYANRMDMAHEKSIALQEAFVDSLGWKAIVQSQINIRYR